MGFVHERVFRLVFADEAYKGLEVRVRSLSIGQVLDIVDPPDGTPREKALRNAQRLAEGLVEWNLEHPGGTAVPMTADGILSQDPALISAINQARFDAVVGVPDPLGPSSNGGPSSDQEASIPMETLPSSPPNSPEHG